jgi:muramoyltetrapeptide carboxypeptidase LdcA involved in peptidoglycan recycling
MDLVTPPKIKKNDKIGIIAPSSGLAKIFPHRVENGRKMLENLGFEVLFAKNSLEIDGYVSATAQKRAQDIHQMFEDKDVKAIICTIGGNHANQVLKYLDFELIKNNPKVFSGYSDITVLHYALAKKANLRTFFGPCLMTEFGEYPEILPYTLEYFKKAVMTKKLIGAVEASLNWTDELLDWSQKKDLERPRHLESNSGYIWWRNGMAEANIFGGTIPSLNQLAGTEYWIDLEDKIFFIDLPEGNQPGEPFSQSLLDAHLADLDNMGVFQKIKGLIIGRPYCYGKDEVIFLKSLIDKYTEGTSYPILFNANIGHVSPIITLPLDVKVRVNSNANEFNILEPGVK